MGVATGGKPFCDTFAKAVISLIMTDNFLFRMGRQWLFLGAALVLMVNLRCDNRKAAENQSSIQTVPIAGVYESGTEARKEALLPDGTKLIMHAGTTLRVSDKFSRGEREVWLEGDAMFEVNAEAGKPFILHTRNLLIQVLGTKFRVDAKKDEAGEEVDLISGKLKVSKTYHSDTDNEPETIQTGEMVMINRDIDLMEKEKMNGTELKDWEGDNK
jgi:transmembrane sensor